MEPKSHGHSQQRPKRGKRSHLEAHIPNTSTQSSTPESDFAFPPLLPEILSEILSRLPVKPLLKFRCVSKSWRDLISSSDFVKMHLKVSTLRRDYANHKILISFDGRQLSQCSLQSVMSQAETVTEAFKVDYPMKSRNDEVWLVGSCNGLVCIASKEKDVFIWNPTTGKFKKVPHLGVKSKPRGFSINGFGYDELNDDYKVVGIFYIFHSTSSYETEEVMLYSLRSDSWRSIGDFDFKGWTLFGTAGTYVKGKIHWALRPDGVTSCWEIVALDLSKEVFGKVGQPYYGEGSSNLTLGVNCGYLCVLCRNRMDLWVMREYGVVESWTKMVTIPPPGFQMDKPFTYLLCLGNNGEVLLASGSAIVVYDPKTNALRCHKVNNFVGMIEAEIYVESLVSPIDDGEAGREQQS